MGLANPLPRWRGSFRQSPPKRWILVKLALDLFPHALSSLETVLTVFLVNDKSIYFYCGPFKASKENTEKTVELSHGVTLLNVCNIIKTTFL